MDTWLTVIIATGIGFVLGYVWGERAGTTDTERRWSEAVKRADDARRPVT